MDIHEFLRYFTKATEEKPRPHEIVILIDASDPLDIQDNYFYGIPTTLGYWDEEREKWFDAKWYAQSSESLDFRDINNNVNGDPGRQPSHWIDDSNFAVLTNRLLRKE